MKCELCKTNNVTTRMSVDLNDVNGTIRAKVCQPCLKKLKNAVRDPKAQRIEIYPVNEEK